MGIRIIHLATVMVVAVLMGGCAGATTQTPVIQTVMHTVPVEVVRDVEVTRIVEITREVVLTQLVEVPVTVTPALPVATATPQPRLQGATPAINLTPQVTPQEKYTGYTPIVVHNRTSDKIFIYLAGPDEFNLTLWGGNQQKIWAREGRYSYKVWINELDAYNGNFNIVSADKYDLYLDGNRAILWVP
jgi:hypothetical protein